MIRLKLTCGMNRQRVRTFLAVVLLLMSLSACISSVTPHENFKSLMAHNVGSSIDNPNVAGSTYYKSLVGSNSLPNGNIENKYRDRGTCRYFFEFDPETRIIVSWRFEGSEKDCVIAPV